MAEIVATASECPHGKMHLWPELGIIEVMDDNSPVLPEKIGSLICTGLLNGDMPLIRYMTGDRASLAENDKKCTCGRSLPLLNSVEGRTDDIFYTSGGRQIGRLDPIFKAHLPVIEAQVVQESLNKVIVRFVPAPDYEPKDGQSIIKRLQERMGDIDVVLEAVSELPREPNGKFRAVISKINQRTNPFP
jgi:phenylacetate-CoA ligase